MSARTEHALARTVGVEARPEGLELTTEGITLILSGPLDELANLASDMLAAIATLARQQHAEEGSAEDASGDCRYCGDSRSCEHCEADGGA